MMFALISFISAEKPKLDIVNSTFRNINVGQPKLKNCGISNNPNAPFQDWWHGSGCAGVGTVNNNVFHDLSTTSQWGAAIELYGYSVDVTLTSNKFLRLTGSLEYAGATYFDKVNIIKLQDNTFEDCTLKGGDTGAGGAIVILNTNTINFIHNEFTRCTNEGENGGSLYVNSGPNPKITMLKNKFSTSVSKKRGGGIHINIPDGLMDCLIQDNVFLDCVAGSYGAGVFFQHSKKLVVSIINNSFINCRSLDIAAVGAGLATSGAGSSVTITDTSFINCESGGCGGGYAHHNAGTNKIVINGCLFDSCKANKNGDAIELENDVAGVTLSVSKSVNNRTRIISGKVNTNSVIGGYADSIDLNYIDFSKLVNSAFKQTTRVSTLGISHCTFSECNYNGFIFTTTTTLTSITFDDLEFRNSSYLFSISANSVSLTNTNLDSIKTGRSTLKFGKLTITGLTLNKVEEVITLDGIGDAYIADIKLIDSFKGIKIDKTSAGTLTVAVDKVSAQNSKIFEITTSVNVCVLKNINGSGLGSLDPYFTLSSPLTSLISLNLTKSSIVTSGFLIDNVKGDITLSNSYFKANSPIIDIKGSVALSDNTFAYSDFALLSVRSGGKLIFHGNTNCIPKPFASSIINGGGTIVTDKNVAITKFYSWNNKCYDESPPTEKFSESRAFKATKEFNFTSEFNQSSNFSESVSFITPSSQFSSSVQFSASNIFTQKPSRSIDIESQAEGEMQNAANKSNNGIGTTALIGIAVGCVIVVVLIIVFAVVIAKKKKAKDTSDGETEFETSSYNFSSESMNTQVAPTNVFTINAEIKDVYDRDFEESNYNFKL